MHSIVSNTSSGNLQISWLVMAEVATRLTIYFTDTTQICCGILFLTRHAENSMVFGTADYQAVELDIAYCRHQEVQVLKELGEGYKYNFTYP